MMRTGAPAAVGVVALLLVTGCSRLAVPSAPALVPYDGPLWIEPAAGVDLWEDPGAAGQVVDCDFAPSGATNASPYNTGEVGETVEDALRIATKEGQFGRLDDELQIAKDEPDRRLYVVQLDGRNYQAVIFHRGPAAPGTGPGRDGIGWWVESYAACDIVDFPDGRAEALGVEVWTDAQGRRMPIDVITSHEGGDCVEGVRFLEIGRQSDAPAQYVAHADRFDDFVDEPYRAHVVLPTDSVASPYRHGDERLWFSPDRRRAYVGEESSDVALWPRTTQRLGCG